MLCAVCWDFGACKLRKMRLFAASKKGGSNNQSRDFVHSGHHSAASAIVRSADDRECSIEQSLPSRQGLQKILAQWS